MMNSKKIKPFTQPFAIESGVYHSQTSGGLPNVGSLNKSRDNVILVCHALTGKPYRSDFPKVIVRAVRYH